MRISNNLLYRTYERNLEDIQTRKLKQEVKITTGKEINTLADNPAGLVKVKQLTNKIDRNEAYKSNIDNALGEMSVIGEELDALNDKVEEIRQLAIESTLTGNASNLRTLGVYVKGLLEDIIKDGNVDFNGRYVFSGTITNGDAITVTPPATNTQPFELVQDPPTLANPSGFRVVFKGNNKDREINKDDASTEIVNVKASEIFGGTGDQVFTSIIDLYNILSFKSDGTPRTSADGFTRADMSVVNQIQQKIEQQAEQINNIAAINGSRMNRLNALKEQIDFENIRLKEYRSFDEDTDYAKATLNLAREDNALQFSLQIGGNLARLSLLDFLG